MLSESSSLFYRPKDKKLHADQARQNFVRSGGDHFTLLNVWERWAETNYSQQFCYEQFLQFKSLSRVRDIRDQLAGLCERVEIVVESNPNTTDITPIQKAITSGYFYNTVRSFLPHSSITLSTKWLGLTPEKRRFIPNAENESDGVRPPIVLAIQSSTSSENRTILRAGYDLQVLHETDHGDKTRLVA